MEADELPSADGEMEALPLASGEDLISPSCLLHSTPDSLASVSQACRTEVLTTGCKLFCPEMGEGKGRSMAPVTDRRTDGASAFAEDRSRGSAWLSRQPWTSGYLRRQSRHGLPPSSKSLIG